MLEAVATGWSDEDQVALRAVKAVRTSLNPTLRESRHDTVVDSALSMARQFANRS